MNLLFTAMTAPGTPTRISLDVTVETATPAERKGLTGIPVFSRSSKSLSRKVERGDVLLAKCNGQIVGLLIAELYGFFDENVVSLIVVEEDLRRKGIGTALVKEAEALFGKGKLFVATYKSNNAMMGLVKSMGYQQVGKIEVPEEESTELIFLKRL